MTIVTSGGAQRAISRIASRGMSCPVGLFGLVRKMIRVRSLMALAHVRRAEMRSPGLGGIGHDAPSGGLHEDGVHLERRRGNDRFRNPVRALHCAERADRKREQALIQSVREHKLCFADAKVRGAFAREHGVVRVVRDIFGGDLSDRVDDGLRAAACVLVEVQPQRALRDRPDGRTSYRHPSTAAAPGARADGAPRSSGRVPRALPARASVMTVGARASSPCRVIR